jgi:glycine oxidase
MDAVRRGGLTGGCNRVSGSDVAIAGTGVLGMAIALAAADAGLQVALVGPGYDTPGAASPAAGAMLGVLGEHTAADEGPQGQADLVFRHESALRWPQWVDEIAEHSGVTVPVHHGTVVIANLENSGDRDNLDAIRDAADILGLPACDLDPRQVPGLRPAPRHAPVAALSCPLEGWVDVDALLAALDTACRAHPRIHRVPRAAHSVLVSGGSRAASGLTLDDNTKLTATHTVLAAGTDRPRPTVPP